MLFLMSKETEKSVQNEIVLHLPTNSNVRGRGAGSQIWKCLMMSPPSDEIFLKTWRRKKTYTAADRSIFWIQNKALDGIPRRHLALLFVTRGGALRSDLWSGDQAGEGPTDCWRLHSPPSCRSHRGNLHTKFHILNGQHLGQNFFYQYGRYHKLQILAF